MASDMTHMLGSTPQESEIIVKLLFGHLVAKGTRTPVKPLPLPPPSGLILKLPNVLEEGKWEQQQDLAAQKNTPW